MGKFRLLTTIPKKKLKNSRPVMLWFCPINASEKVRQNNLKNNLSPYGLSHTEVEQVEIDNIGFKISIDEQCSISSTNSSSFIYVNVTHPALPDINRYQIPVYCSHLLRHIIKHGIANNILNGNYHLTNHGTANWGCLEFEEISNLSGHHLTIYEDEKEELLNKLHVVSKPEVGKLYRVNNFNGYTQNYLIYLGRVSNIYERSKGFHTVDSKFIINNQSIILIAKEPTYIELIPKTHLYLLIPPRDVPENLINRGKFSLRELLNIVGGFRNLGIVTRTSPVKAQYREIENVEVLISDVKADIANYYSDSRDIPETLEDFGFVNQFCGEFFNKFPELRVKFINLILNHVGKDEECIDFVLSKSSGHTYENCWLLFLFSKEVLGIDLEQVKVIIDEYYANLNH